MTLSKRLRNFAGRALFPAVELLWSAACVLFGRVLRPERWVRRWSPGAEGRVVVVAPHPDDETVGAGGVAALHARAGDHVTVVVVTDGRSSRAGGLAADDMATRRSAELAAAAHILGIDDVVQLRLPEDGWDESVARARLAPLLVEAQLVYAPSCVDYHPEHIRVARVIADLLHPAQIVRVYELGVPLTPLLANVLADIRSVESVKACARAQFATQQAALAPLRRMARYRSNLYNVAAAELFWELPAETYARVMAAARWPGTPGPFRGIRPWTLSDPLMALVGMRARRWLRGVAASPGPRPRRAGETSAETARA